MLGVGLQRYRTRLTLAVNLPVTPRRTIKIEDISSDVQLYNTTLTPPSVGSDWVVPYTYPPSSPMGSHVPTPSSVGSDWVVPYTGPSSGLMDNLVSLPSSLPSGSTMIPSISGQARVELLSRCSSSSSMGGHHQLALEAYRHIPERLPGYGQPLSAESAIAVAEAIPSHISILANINAAVSAFVSATGATAESAARGALIAVQFVRNPQVAVSHEYLWHLDVYIRPHVERCMRAITTDTFNLIFS